MPLDDLEAASQLVDFGLKGAGVLQLPPGSGRAEDLIEHGRHRDDALGAVRPSDHPGRDAPAAIPRPERRAGDPGGINRLLQGDPTFLDGLVGQLAEQVIPIDAIGIPCGAVHRVITTVLVWYAG